MSRLRFRPAGYSLRLHNYRAGLFCRRISTVLQAPFVYRGGRKGTTFPDRFNRLFSATIAALRRISSASRNLLVVSSRPRRSVRARSK